MSAGSGSGSSAWSPSEVDAHRAAREEVASMFRSAEQLGRLPAFLAECNRKKAAIEAQLSSAVRTQVDETRLGLQLLNESAALMHQMRNNFHAIDSYCRDCKMVLRDSPEIQKVNTARKNLDATTRLLDKFRSLPAQAEALLEELDDSDRAIKSVYKRMRLLFRLRDSARDQQSGSMPGGQGGFSAEFSSQLEESIEELNRSAAAVEDRVWENIDQATYLAKEDPVTLVRTLEVIEMEDHAMRKVFGGRDKAGAVSSTGAVVLSGDKASQLSMKEKCLNVMEKAIADLFNHLHIDEEQSAEQERKAAAEKKKKAAQLEEYKAKLRKEDAERRRAQRIADGEDDDDVDEPEEINTSPQKGPGAKGGLFHSGEDDEDELIVKVNKDGAPSDYIIQILEELSELVTNLPRMLESTAVCFPPDYDLIPFFMERYCRWMKLTLSFHCNEPVKLSKRAQLKAVNWIEWYRGHLRTWEQRWPGTTPLRRVALRPDEPGIPPSERKSRADANRKELAEIAFFEDLIRELMKCYTASTTETLLKLCDNILAAEEKSTAEQNPEGQYVTTAPSDLFYTINSTIEIVLQSFGLNAQPLSHVCLMVADIFTYYQNAQLKFLGESNTGTGPDGDDLILLGPQRLAKDDTWLCACINNCSMSQGHMDDLKDKILDRLREAEGIEDATPLQTANGMGSAAGLEPKTLLEQMEDTFEECGEGFVNVSAEATDLLVLGIMMTLAKPISNLFTAAWLKDPQVTNDIVLTLEDYATDYKRWIGREAYFGRVLTKCLTGLISQYLHALVSVKPLLQVSTDLFERLVADKKMISEFFLKYATSVSDGGLGEIIPGALVKSETRLLTLIGKVVAEDPDFMSVHFDKIIARFGPDSKDLFSGLLAMRTDLTKQQKKEVMDKFVSKMPAADPAALLQQQLIAQGVAAMASPKGKDKRNKDDEAPSKSFWDRFKSDKNEAKVKEKPKPSAALATKKSNADDEGHSMAEFIG